MLPTTKKPKTRMPDIDLNAINIESVEANTFSYEPKWSTGVKIFITVFAVALAGTMVYLSNILLEG